MVPVYFSVQVIIAFIYGVLSFIGMVLAFVYSIRRKSVFGTFMDGLFFGTLAIIGVLYAVSLASQGKFPFSIDAIYL